MLQPLEGFQQWLHFLMLPLQGDGQVLLLPQLSDFISKRHDSC